MRYREDVVTSDDSTFTAVAVLSEELRRRMYDFIRRTGRPVTRDEAAESVGISRKLAAFHLDKLVAAGLLTAGYARPAEPRRVGRTPKVYEPSGLDVHLSVPHREHDLLAGILVEAIGDQGAGESGTEAALRVAAEHGRRVAAEDGDPPKRLGPERALTHASRVLERHGFEPARDAPTLVRLRNCPFHPLAADAPEVVCAINHAFLTGVLEGLGATTVQATLVPRPGACCVELGTP